MSHVKIREAKPQDLKDVASVVLDSFVDEIHTNISELESPDITSHKKFCNFYYQRAKAKIPFIIYVAEKDGEIIGGAAGAVGEHHWGNQKWGSEDFWFVKKEHRGGKTGILLFDKLMKWFKEKEAKRIQMTHYTWNPGIQEF